MLVAIATHPDSELVDQFGRESLIFLHELDGAELVGTEQVFTRNIKKHQLAEAVADADVLICTGADESALRQLDELGVPVATVPEGVNAQTAVIAWLSHTQHDYLKSVVYTDEGARHT